MSFRELPGSPEESFSESGGPSVVRRLLVPYDQRIARAAELSNTLYPHFPDCRVVAMAIVPFFGEQSVPSGPEVLNPGINSNEYFNHDGTPKDALLTVNYGPDFTSKVWSIGKPAFREGTELRHQITGGGEFYELPSSATKWEAEAGATPPDGEDSDDPAVLESNETVLRISKNIINIQWDFVDEVPVARFEELTGKVNQGMFLNSPPETILFNEYNVEESFKAQPIDPHTNRVTCVFERRAIPTPGGIVGWNHDYREDPAGWAKLLLADDEPRYETAVFNQMFT